MSKSIEILLLDNEGFTISDEMCETVLIAKKRASYMLTDEWAITCETSHADLNTHKVECRVNGECVWDKFLKGSNNA